MSTLLKPVFILVAAALFIFLQPPLADATDELSAEDAKRSFRICSGCHSMDGSTYQSVAPDLANLQNRIAGTNAGFNYSGAMRVAGQRGLAWNAETLNLFLANPNAMIQGTKMKFKGFSDAAERINVIQWLLEASKNGHED